MWLIPIIGLVSLIWFLVRVIPKPSRAAYPCQQAAAPLASGFVVWLIAVFGSASAFKRGRALVATRRARALFCFGLGLAAAGIAYMAMPEQIALADPPSPNNPVGVARGVQPGRVVWVHDPDATDWLGVGHGHWWQSDHTDQAVVDGMMSTAIRRLTGETTDAEAWDALFTHFNQTHGQGSVGYTPGEKIAIKVNLVGCIDANGWGSVDPTTYNMTWRLDYMNASPQMMLALLRQLVYQAGVSPADIAIGDPVCLFPNEYHDPLAAEFPDVEYIDSRGLFGRTQVAPSTTDFHWSCTPPGVVQDKVLIHFAEADYFINMANFKSHSMAGVTVTGKNLYGWLRLPTAGGHYDLHESLPTVSTSLASYRCIVDLMGHADSGGKGLLYLIDGLYAGVHPDDNAPIRWAVEPFNDDWTSSLFVSQDPVALDSVAFDFMQLEGDPRQYPQMWAVDDYLVEAALADNPPSGTFYDPDHAGNVTRLRSLGVHEHWNNASERLYSRNLDPVLGTGIELIAASPSQLFADGFEDGTSQRWTLTVGRE
jgi:hypothetical protein